jgi:hypothetical protein
MKRVIVLLIAATTVGLLASSMSASAQPPSTTRLVLTCDRGSAATVTVTLQDAQTPTQSSAVPLNCDATVGNKSDRLLQPTDFTVGWATVSSFDVGAQTCSVGGTLPLKLNCADATGANATVVAR